MERASACAWSHPLPPPPPLFPFPLPQEAHQNGTAAVIVCGQPDAERYCEGLRGNGLIASIEPAGGGGGKGDDPAS